MMKWKGRPVNIRKKGWCKMMSKVIRHNFGLVVCCLLFSTVSLGTMSRPSKTLEQEYREELASIRGKTQSLKAEHTVDLESYGKYAHDLQEKWGKKDKELQARVARQLCMAIANRQFTNASKCNALAREYALSVLDKPDGVTVKTQLELTGYAITTKYESLTDEEFARCRRRNIEARLAVLKRLTDAIDPNWDPNEMMPSYKIVAVRMGLPSSTVPESIEDPKLRAEYIAALQEYKDKHDKWSRQYALHKWLARYPKNVERQAISSYSSRPYNIEELQTYLDKYETESEAKKRILDAVSRNMKMKE